jgi:hypothetical protein
VSGLVGRAGSKRRWQDAYSALAAATLLTACARDPVVTGVDARPAGNWCIERQVDRITGAPISSALLPTPTVSNATIAFPPPAQMQLLCFKEQPAVLLAFQFMVGSTRNAEFSYRFDDKPGHMARALHRRLQESDHRG